MLYLSCIVKNPIFLWIGVAILVIVVGTGAIFVLPRKTSSPVPPHPTNVQVSEKIPSKTTKTYTDESGFSFQYPDDLIIQKKESADPSVYSSLEVTSKTVSGNILIRVEDTKETNLDKWFGKQVNSARLVLKDTKLGDLPAKQFTFDERIMVAAIDQGILFRVEGVSQKEKLYWPEVYRVLLASFSFVATQTSQAASDSSGDDVILEEEVIE